MLVFNASSYDVITCGLARPSEKFQKRGSQVIKRSGEFAEPRSVCDLARLFHTTPKHTHTTDGAGVGRGRKRDESRGNCRDSCSLSREPDADGGKRADKKQQKNGYLSGMT